MAEKTPKLSDSVEFTTGIMAASPILPRTSSVTLRGCLQFDVQIPVADGSDSRWISHTKDKIRRQIVEMIQPRADFEAAFQDLRDKIQGLNLSSMSETMAVLGAIAELKEKLLLK